MSYNFKIRTLAWISFWFLLFLTVTTDWNDVMHGWRQVHDSHTTFPASHSDWG